MKSIIIRPPSLEDETAFLAMTQASQQFHHPWIKAPQTHDEFIKFMVRYQQPNQKSYLLCTSENQIAGVFNISEIVRGSFQSGYLGFYAAAGYAGKGLMSSGLKLLLNEVFNYLNLHRLEANIQLANKISLQLISNNGFKREGCSARYLKINDEWCDHERCAITLEDWQQI